MRTKKGQKKSWAAVEKRSSVDDRSKAKAAKFRCSNWNEKQLTFQNSASLSPASVVSTLFPFAPLPKLSAMLAEKDESVFVEDSSRGNNRVNRRSTQQAIAWLITSGYIKVRYNSLIVYSWFKICNQDRIGTTPGQVNFGICIPILNSKINARPRSRLEKNSGNLEFTHLFPIQAMNLRILFSARAHQRNLKIIWLTSLDVQKMFPPTPL